PAGLEVTLPPPLPSTTTMRFAVAAADNVVVALPPELDDTENEADLLPATVGWNLIVIEQVAPASRPMSLQSSFMRVKSPAFVPATDVASDARFVPPVFWAETVAVDDPPSATDANVGVGGVSERAPGATPIPDRETSTFLLPSPTETLAVLPPETVGAKT